MTAPTPDAPSGATCKGSFVLGSACCRCTRCLEERARLTAEGWIEIFPGKMVRRVATPTPAPSAQDAAFEAAASEGPSLAEIEALSRRLRRGVEDRDIFSFDDAMLAMRKGADALDRLSALLTAATERADECMKARTAAMLDYGAARLEAEERAEQAEAALARKGAEATRTDEEIVAETNDLARYILRNLINTGYEVPPDTKFYEANNNPRLERAWDYACEIMEMLTHTEVSDALGNIEEAALAEKGDARDAS